MGIRSGADSLFICTDSSESTYEYGVSFERGTYVDYGDRRQVFISGTASINHRGEVVYPGDIRKQTERMWENVETLLKEAEMSFDDIGQMLGLPARCGRLCRGAGDVRPAFPGNAKSDSIGSCLSSGLADRDGVHGHKNDEAYTVS